MLAKIITQRALRTPAKPALIHNGCIWSYAGFAQGIATSRLHWAQQKMPPGSIVVLAIRHLALAWVHGIALRSLGYTTVCLPANQQLSSLKLAGIGAIVTTPVDRTASLVQQAAQKDWPLHLASALPSLDGTDQTVPSLPDTLTLEAGHILMTSGTTGDYKMVLRSAAADAATLLLHAEINAITGASVVYVGEFPKLTAGGYRWPLMTWSQGGTVVWHQGDDPHVAFQHLRLTHAFATPQTLQHLLKAPDGRLPRQDDLHLLVTGGALPKALARAAQARLTPKVFTVLASTEALTLSVTPVAVGDAEQRHQVHHARTAEVVDEADRPLPPGQMGLLRIRVLDGVDHYLHDAAASARFFRDGYFYPGDLATLTAEGQLILQGRATDVISALGDKIATAPYEQALQDCLGVTGVCLFSIQNAAGEDDLHVAIECPEMMEPPLLQQALRELLGSAFHGIRYHLVTELPRNHMGKVQRGLLQQMILTTTTAVHGQGFP